MPNKKSFTGAVVGNGKVIGITNGTDKGGISAVNAHYFHGLGFYGAAYGQNLPYGSSENTSTGSIGITTESANSGIICEIDNKYNYIIKY